LASGDNQPSNSENLHFLEIKVGLDQREYQGIAR
jgi:hypothetical protein